ncbi:hypothetical protein LXA43DRAFT_1148902 [Ganoderma leucocontextum]|nr:hypothetical protein LXA43DRAFT_1148902 [Ganoderma leucocontextum]
MFADDEDKMEHDDKEGEEAKELEERLKGEYKTANKLREGYIDESESKEGESKLTNTSKDLSPAPYPVPPRRAPAPKADDNTTPQPPERPFTEYRLMSSKLNGWMYDVMMFESRKRVEINDWAMPVKLNRKDQHRIDPAAQPSQQQAVMPMVGSDGKQGQEVEWFQKKTRQVFLVPEATRQLRRDEKFPWVIEDGGQKEVQVADFQKKPSHHIPNWEEAETLMTKLQKRKDATHWTLRQKTEQAAASSSSLVHSAGQSRGHGGRKLRTVDSGTYGLFGDDDEEGVDSKRRVKEGGLCSG